MEEDASEPEGREGYENVLDVYCTNVLPALEEWDYAKDFLQYETELDASRREVRLFAHKPRDEMF